MFFLLSYPFHYHFFKVRPLRSSIRYPSFITTDLGQPGFVYCAAYWPVPSVACAPFCVYIIRVTDRRGCGALWVQPERPACGLISRVAHRDNWHGARDNCIKNDFFICLAALAFCVNPAPTCPIWWWFTVPTLEDITAQIKWVHGSILSILRGTNKCRDVFYSVVQPV